MSEASKSQVDALVEANHPDQLPAGLHLPLHSIQATTFLLGAKIITSAIRKI
jgi:hypothetical protein